MNDFIGQRLEALLSRPANRQSRRQFERIVRKHWPFKVNPLRFPRLAIFVEKLEAKTHDSA